MLDGDDGALESLKSLAVTFLDLNLNANRCTYFQLGKVGSNLLFGERMSI